MRKLILIAVPILVFISAIDAEASTTAIQSTPPGSSFAGQAVTFTAGFTSSCDGTVTTHYFTIDGKVQSGTFVQSGRNGTETLSIATLAVGTHKVSYNWQQRGTICRGVASTQYTVQVQPSPSPSPSPSASPSLTPSATPSDVSVALAAATSSNGLIGYIGAALIIFALASGVALALQARR